jgi:predicted metal-dependent phosphoesterase TrpH
MDGFGKLTIKKPNRLVDLHTHTFYSDGVLSPSDLVEKAKKTGLAAIAITDHDSINGLKEGLAVGKKFGVEVVPGAEITSYPDEKQEFHFLGYYLDWENKGLQKVLEESQKGREERAKKVIKKLNSFGYLINFGDLKAFSRGTIVQPHIAWLVINDKQNKKKLLSDFGGIPSTGDFIVKYLIPGAPAYESRETLPPKEAIDLIHKYNGLVVLGHPCWSITKKEGSDLIFDDAKVKKLVKLGLDGIEVFAHRENEEDTKKCVDHYGKIAKEAGLLVTGGSDYHGFGSAGKELGFSDFYLEVPYKALENLKAKVKN